MIQPPGDGHRALALVGDVGRRAEEGVRSRLTAAIFMAASDEKQNLGSPLGVVDIPLSGFAFFSAMRSSGTRPDAVAA